MECEHHNQGGREKTKQNMSVTKIYLHSKLASRMDAAFSSKRFVVAGKRRGPCTELWGTSMMKERKIVVYPGCWTKLVLTYLQPDPAGGCDSYT